MKVTVSSLLLSLLATGILAAGPDGFQWGSAVFRPEASVLGAYDNRALRNADGYVAGTYAEWLAGLSLNNLPAMINYSATGRYGQRYYTESSGLDSSFYTLRGAVASGDSPLIWSLSTDWSRTLDYNSGYDPESGQQPDSILTSEDSIRSVSEGTLGYDIKISDASSLRPSYALQHYYQTFQSSSNAEWQIHQADVQYRRKQSEATVLTVGGTYGLQVNGEEEGSVASVTLGLERKVSAKTSLLASIGYSFADYELSGTDQGVVSNLRGSWSMTEKISVYLFGGNDFQPGYGGGAARWVYRLGYGMNWSALEKISLQASVLHDYQDVIGSNVSNDPSLGTLRSFFDASLNYSIWSKITSGLSYRYVRDELTPDQQVVALQLGYVY